jgi:hypothetical protein
MLRRIIIQDLRDESPTPTRNHGNNASRSFDSLPNCAIDLNNSDCWRRALRLLLDERCSVRPMKRRCMESIRARRSPQAGGVVAMATAGWRRLIDSLVEWRSLLGGDHRACRRAYSFKRPTDRKVVAMILRGSSGSLLAGCPEGSLNNPAAFKAAVMIARGSWTPTPAWPSPSFPV